MSQRQVEQSSTDADINKLVKKEVREYESLPLPRLLINLRNNSLKLVEVNPATLDTNKREGIKNEISQLREGMKVLQDGYSDYFSPDEQAVLQQVDDLMGELYQVYERPGDLSGLLEQFEPVLSKLEGLIKISNKKYIKENDLLDKLIYLEQRVSITSELAKDIPDIKQSILDELDSKLNYVNELKTQYESYDPLTLEDEIGKLTFGQSKLEVPIEKLLGEDTISVMQDEKYPKKSQPNEVPEKKGKSSTRGVFVIEFFQMLMNFLSFFRKP